MSPSKANIATKMHAVEGTLIVMKIYHLQIILHNNFVILIWTIMYPIMYYVCKCVCVLSIANF